MNLVVSGFALKIFLIGLNLQSWLNLENVTVFNINEQESTLGQNMRLI